MTGKALREKDSTLLTDQQHLEKLMYSEWNERISHLSMSTLYGRRFNKIELLPLTKGLEIFHKYLCKQISILSKSLIEVPTLQSWKELAETTPTRLIVFNKRRGGEASKLTVRGKRHEKTTCVNAFHQSNSTKPAVATNYWSRPTRPDRIGKRLHLS